MADVGCGMGDPRGAPEDTRGIPEGPRGVPEDPRGVLSGREECFLCEKLLWLDVVLVMLSLAKFPREFPAKK